MKHAQAIKLIADRLAMNAQNLANYAGAPEPYEGYLDELKAHDASLRESLAFLRTDNTAPAPEDPHAD